MNTAVSFQETYYQAINRSAEIVRHMSVNDFLDEANEVKVELDEASNTLDSISTHLLSGFRDGVQGDQAVQLPRDLLMLELLLYNFNFIEKTIASNAIRLACDQSFQRFRESASDVREILEDFRFLTTNDTELDELVSQL